MGKCTSRRLFRYGGFCPFPRNILRNPDFYSVSEKVAAALIVRGECGAETIADYNNKTDGIYSLQHISLDLVSLRIITIQHRIGKINAYCL